MGLDSLRKGELTEEVHQLHLHPRYHVFVHCCDCDGAVDGPVPQGVHDLGLGLAGVYSGAD